MHHRKQVLYQIYIFKPHKKMNTQNKNIQNPSSVNLQPKAPSLKNAPDQSIRQEDSISFQKIKSKVCECFSMIRIFLILPLSVLSRIANIYFLVRIVTADDQGFDTWWKLLSLIGYIFYITAGSILFFIIAPDLEINFGRKIEKSGHYGGIFGDLQGLVLQSKEMILLQENRFDSTINNNQITLNLALKRKQSPLQLVSRNKNFDPQQQELFIHYQALGQISQSKDDKGEIVQQLMRRMLKHLCAQIKRVKKTRLNYKDETSNFYKWVYQQTLLEATQYDQIRHELDRMSRIQKYYLSSLLLIRKQQHIFNITNGKQKKFYLFLFNLLNATDAMIAWYNYYDLPDAHKFQRFEIPYYFILLCFEDIPQIIAQGCSLKFAYENGFNVTVFVISVITLLTTTIYNIYKVKKHSLSKQPEPKIQQFLFECQELQKIFGFETSIRQVPKSLYDTLTQKFLKFGCKKCWEIFALISFIVCMVLVVVNRIILYIFLSKISSEDTLLYWLSMICLGYYFVMGNSLLIITYPVNEQWRGQDICFLVFLIILFNIIDGGFIFVIISFIRFSCCYHYSESFLFQVNLRYFYISLAFETIPFIIIYSMALSRVQGNHGFYITAIILKLICVISIGIQTNHMRDNDEIMDILFTKSIFKK